MSPFFHTKLGELIIHIFQGTSAEVARLIENDPSLVNAEHPSGTTPLYFAVRHQTPRIAEYLIGKGASANPTLLGRESLVQLADQLPDQEILDMLFAAGGRVKSNQKQKSESLPVYPTIAELTEHDLPLCAAAERPAKSNKLAANFKQRRLRQLLTYACRERADRLGHRLIQILPTVDYCTDDEGSPLLAAALSGSLDLLRSLWKAGSRRELIGAFEFAVERGHVAIARELLPHIQEKKYRNYFDREAPLMALRSATKGYTEMAELLLPFANKRSVTIAQKKIEEWRKDYLDLVPQHFSWPNEDPFEYDD